MHPSPNFHIRPARPDDCAELTDICIRAKGHWGYAPELMEAWRAELTVTPEKIARQIARVAVSKEKHLAGVGKVDIDGDPPFLDLLFVDPPFHGQRVGSLLLDALSDDLARRQIDRLVIDADPNAERFYVNQGARRVGEAPSANTPGRMLPRLELATKRLLSEASS